MDPRSSQLSPPIPIIRVSDVEMHDLKMPDLLADLSVEEKEARVLEMCDELLADLQCLQLAYAFKPKQFNRDTIEEHLQEMIPEVLFLKDSQSLFSSHDEYLEWMDLIHETIEDTITVVKGMSDREGFHIKAQQEKHEELIREVHPRYKPTAQAWDQFLASGAPSLPVTHFLAPYPVPAPKDEKYPHMRQIKATSVQALPQATSGILAKWTWSFKSAIDYYHELHPEDPDFKGPIQRKLIPRTQSQLTPEGLKMEACRLHNLGIHPYARAMEWVTVNGEEGTGNLGRFLGRLEEKDVPTPAAANRVYVVRRWVLSRDM